MHFKLPKFYNDFVICFLFATTNGVIFYLNFKLTLFLTPRILDYKKFNLVYIGSEDNILLPMQYRSSHH